MDNRIYDVEQWQIISQSHENRRIHLCYTTGLFFSWWATTVIYPPEEKAIIKKWAEEFLIETNNKDIIVGDVFLFGPKDEDVKYSTYQIRANFLNWLINKLQNTLYDK